MKVSFIRVSANRKTGPIPVSTTERASCPDVCPLKGNGCYAEAFPSVLHWNKVPEKGMGWAEFCLKVGKLPAGTLWRHNVAGDLPADKAGTINQYMMRALVSANMGRNGFTYTHHALTEHNQEVIEEANANGFTINISCNDALEAAHTVGTIKAPVVCLLPHDAPNTQVVAGVQIVACPAEKSDRVTCADCGLCALTGRQYVIGFRAHGNRAKRVDLIARG